MKKIFAILLSVLVICGCAGCDNNAKPDGNTGITDNTQDTTTTRTGNSFFPDIFGTPEDLTGYSDSPENSKTTIRKAENGYYYISETGIRILMFHDIKSDTSVALCNKPECEHNGNDNCISGIVTENCFSICDDYLYYPAQENNNGVIEIVIYKVALNGSSRTKAATICSVKPPEGKGSSSQSQATLHKGKIYCSYKLTVGEYNAAYTEYGVAEYDIATGTVKTIYDKSGNGKISSYIQDFVSLGEFVFFREDGTLFRYDTTNEKLNVAIEDGVFGINSDGKYLYSYLPNGFTRIDTITYENKLIIETKDITAHLNLDTIAVYNGYTCIGGEGELKNGFYVFDPDGNEVTSLDLGKIFKESGFNIDNNSRFLFRLGIIEENLIISATPLNEEHVPIHLIFGCDFKSLINKTDVPKLIFVG